MSDELYELTNLKAEEVSLVDRGANMKKRFPIFKREKVMDKKMRDILKAVLETEVDGEAELLEAVKKSGGDEKAASAAQAVLRIMQSFKDKLSKETIAELQKIAGMDKADDEEYEAPEKADEEEEEEEMGKNVEKSKDGDTQAVLKAYEDQIANLTKSNEEIRKALDAEVEKRELARWVDIAKTELAFYPGQSAEELGETLYKLHKADPDLAKKQLESMKAASKSLEESGVFKEAGMSGDKGKAASAWEEIEKQANGMVEKSGYELNEHVAKARFLMSPKGKDLYTQYLRENPAQSGSRG